MKFCWNTLKVKNLNESIYFYEKILGLSLNRRFKAEPNMEIAFLGNGETQIELIYDKAIEKIAYGEHISLGFEVESVEKMMEFIKVNNIEICSGIINPNPKIKFFYILDPNGLRIQFVENIKNKE